VNKEASMGLAEEDNEAFQLAQQANKVQREMDIQKDSFAADLQRKEADIKLKNTQDTNSAVAKAKAELTEFNGNLQAKVHQAEMEASQTAAQATLAEQQALTEVQVARQQTATKVAEQKANAEKEIATERAHMLEELDSMKAGADAEVQSARHELEEAKQAEEEAAKKTTAAGKKAKADAMAMANVRIAAIKKAAYDSLDEATKLAVDAKKKEIEDAQAEANAAIKKMQDAQDELSRVEEQIQEEKNAQRLEAKEIYDQIDDVRAQLKNAQTKEDGLVRKQRMFRTVLQHAHEELKQTQGVNEKLRSFMLVYRSSAENLRSDAHSAKWQLANLQRKQKENGKVLAVAKTQSAKARDETYQLRSQLESLERARRSAVAKAAEKQRLAEDRRVQRMADKKKEAKLAMAAKEAMRSVELQRLKMAAQQAAAAARAFAK
jgi:hypothetical protein